MTSNDNELAVGCIRHNDVRSITPAAGSEGEPPWNVLLRCDATVGVPFAVIDDLGVLFDFDLDNVKMPTDCIQPCREGKCRYITRFTKCLVVLESEQEP